MIFISIQNSNYKGLKSFSSSFKSLRNDIVDRNNILLSRNVVAYGHLLAQEQGASKRLPV